MWINNSGHFDEYLSGAKKSLNPRPLCFKATFTDIVMTKNIRSCADIFAVVVF